MRAYGQRPIKTGWWEQLPANHPIRDDLRQAKAPRQMDLAITVRRKNISLSFNSDQIVDTVGPDPLLTGS
jgi:hypothetical protein